MTPEYILRKSLCRTPHCAGPHALRDVPLKDWPADKREAYQHDALSRINDMRYMCSYGEPGYTDPAKGVLLANWNYFSREVGDLLEAYGYDVEWEDEWIDAYETGKIYRSSPNSYSWTPYYWLTDDGDVYGGDEIEEGGAAQESYIEYLTNNPHAANLFGIDFEALGWQRHNGDFETGWHPGQTDDSNKVFAELEDKYDVIFDMKGGASQFYTTWHVWVKDKE